MPPRLPALEDVYTADIIERAQQLVANANPREGVDYRTRIVRYACDYLTWADANGIDVDDIDALLSDETVDRYREALKEAGQPPGTYRSTTSIIRRLHPNIGLAGTRHGDPTPKPARHVPQAPKKELAPLRDEIRQKLQAYRATVLDDDTWQLVRPLTLEAVTAAAPHTTTRAVHMMRLTAYLAAYAHEHDLPLRVDTVLHPDTVNKFIADTTNHADGRSIANYASLLRQVAIAVGQQPIGELAARPGAKGGDGGDLYDPYQLDDVDRFLRATDKLRTAHRRRHATAGIALVAAFGYTPGETDWARPAHLTDTGATVTATIHTPACWDLRASEEAAFDNHAGPAAGTVRNDLLIVRATVQCLPGWEPLIRTVLNDAQQAGDEFLLGGAGDQRNGRWYRTVTDHNGVDVNSRRLRGFWLREHLEPLIGGQIDVLATNTLHLNRLFGR